MIEARVIQYLGASQAIPVYAERPDNPDAEYLLVERTGKSKDNHVLHATIVIQSYADSLYRAAQISDSVEKLMEGFAALENIESTYLTLKFKISESASACWDNVVKSFLPGRL